MFGEGGGGGAGTQQVLVAHHAAEVAGRLTGDVVRDRDG